MQFASDNRAGVTPEILEALAAEAADFGGAYGEDAATERLTRRFAEMFERDVTVFPVLTGTAANSLALACLCDPWGAVICHTEAHIAVDECGAPEFFGGGLRLVPIEGDGARIGSDHLSGLLDAIAADRTDVHRVPVQAFSLTNLSELGRAYGPDETAALCEVAHGHGVATHLDGARFANVVASTGASPADLTWRAGIDVMSFGATKNGALAAEAVVFFDDTHAATFERRRKRAGQLFSKMRFVSIQLLASLTDDRWLRTARHANALAGRLADGLAGLEGVTPPDRPDGNEVFVVVDNGIADAWRQGGGQFYGAPAGDRTMVRLVTSFATTAEHVTSFLAMAREVSPSADREPSDPGATQSEGAATSGGGPDEEDPSGPDLDHAT